MLYDSLHTCTICDILSLRSCYLCTRLFHKRKPFPSFFFKKQVKLTLKNLKGMRKKRHYSLEKPRRNYHVVLYIGMLLLLLTLLLLSAAAKTI